MSEGPIPRGLDFSFFFFRTMTFSKHMEFRGRIEGEVGGFAKKIDLEISEERDLRKREKNRDCVGKVQVEKEIQV